MAELLSAGVFVEEVPSQISVVQGVSTSNLGIIGFTKAGPTNDPTLVTSFEQFTKIFGSLDPNTFMGLSVAAFFSNGGRRAFVNRVVPSDSLLAEAWLNSKIYHQELATGDDAGTPTFAKTSATSPILDNSPRPDNKTSGG